MKREELIKTKLDEKQTVDFVEIREDDKRSLDRIIRDEEDSLYDIEKSIKKYLSDHTLTLGEDFVTMIQKKNEHTSRIELLKQIKEKYV